LTTPNLLNYDEIEKDSGRSLLIFDALLLSWFKSISDWKNLNYKFLYIYNY